MGTKNTDTTMNTDTRQQTKTALQPSSGANLRERPFVGIAREEG
jgi:hypothetical protein